ncbi:Alg9-like mannosyltransferase family-domain-containing protein [Trametes polyzona]|nr:Alg9-like mannosyltransferase family-domain-containing protein [Trametes polyzona]
MTRANLGRYAYLGLVILRVLSAFLGTGYIHPDEYFQNGEVTAGHVLGLNTHLTWEWNPVFPCRSVVPVWLTTGLPFLVLQHFQKGGHLSPRFVFAAERLPFLLSSFLLDYSVYHLVHDSARLHALLLLASSYVMHTYQVRPFSNSTEAILVAVSLVLLKGLFTGEVDRKTSKRGPAYLALLVFVCVSGLFTRITFVAFFLPIGFELLKWSLRETRFSLHALARLLSLPLLVAFTTVLVFVYADSAYFHGSTWLSTIEFTPLNFLRYNLLPSNLAEHGLHPRWLHLVVNFPMIATPGLLFYVLWAELDIATSRSREIKKDRAGVVERMQTVYQWVRLSATSILSIQPHQEPRFLTPLLVPMIALAVNNARILQARRPFMILWVVSNLALAALFGILHQGGVVPSLFRVHDIIYHDARGMRSYDYQIVYWKTYMPPRHLLGIRQADVDSGSIVVHDVAGTSPALMVDSLALLTNSTFSKPLSALLVAPFHAVRELDKGLRECMRERDRVFPHLDLDHIAESVQAGWRDGLSLGIFDVNTACLREALPSER